MCGQQARYGHFIQVFGLQGGERHGIGHAACHRIQDPETWWAWSLVAGGKSEGCIDTALASPVVPGPPLLPMGVARPLPDILLPLATDLAWEIYFPDLAQGAGWAWHTWTEASLILNECPHRGLMCFHYNSHFQGVCLTCHVEKASVTEELILEICMRFTLVSTKNKYSPLYWPRFMFTWSTKP